MGKFEGKGIRKNKGEVNVTLKIKVRVKI